MSAANNFTVRSDQWDIRLNIPNVAWIESFTEKIDEYIKEGTVRYIHVSGAEMGDVPGRSSFGQLHIHIALVLFNYTSKRSIVKRFSYPNLGWYIEARDKTKSITGWVDYHSKPRSKVDPRQTLVYKYGDLPKPKVKRVIGELTQGEELKKRQKFMDWDRKKTLMKLNDWEQLDMEFPGFIYSSMGQSMKREVMKQANDEWTKPLNGKLKNYIIWGGSGTGKSSSIALMYPNCYKKQKGSQYWDAYDKCDPNHGIVWIDEMSKETLKTMTGKADGGFEFLKELADRYPVTVDEKYTKGYKIRPKTVIITMNEHPTSLLPDRAVEVNKQALFRKFRILHVEGRLPPHPHSLPPHPNSHLIT